MNGQETWSSEWLDLAEMDLGAAEYLLGCVQYLWRSSAITANRQLRKC